MPTPINYVFCPTIDSESPNCDNVKLAIVRAICFCFMRVRYLLTLIFSGLDFGKPQNDLPTLVHIAPSNETNVFDAVASSILQSSMLKEI